MFMSRLEPYTYALFRIATGFLFLWHGAQKLFSFPAPAPQAPWHILYVAGPIEFVGGLLIMIGLLTNWVGFLCSGLMAAAYFMAHFPRESWFPLSTGGNQGELAVLYCFAFLLMSSRGSGIWSLDALFGMAKQGAPAYGSRSSASRS
jgi:putative oxidoreductase